MRRRSSTHAPAPKPARKQRDAAPADGAKRGKLPQQQAPQLASVADEPPEGKAGSARSSSTAIACCAGTIDGKVRLVTRNGLDWTDRLPAVARAVGRLHVEYGAAGRRTGGAATGRRVQLSRPAGGAVGRQGRNAASLSVRSAAPGRLGPAAVRAGRAQARAVGAGRLARHAALQRPSDRRCGRMQREACRRWAWKASSASRPMRRIARAAARAG